MEDRIKCDCCGKFMGYKELLNPKSSMLFIPDSPLSIEELYYRCITCITCTAVYGIPKSKH